MTETSHAPEAIRGILVAAEDRPRPAGALSSSLTYAWRALLKIKHVPEQLFDVTVFPLMMTAMMTYIFGGAMGAMVSGDAGATGSEGVRAFVQFFIPGIFVQTLVMVTIYTGLTLNKDISKGIFDRFRSLPTWRPGQLVGALLGDQVRYVLAGVIILVVGFAIGFRPEGGVFGVLAGFALMLIFAFSLSWLWTLVSLLVRTEQAAMGISMFVMMPLTFASNIFVPPATMPDWLRTPVELNPVSVLVAEIRALMGGSFNAGDVLVVLIYCGVLVAVFAPLSMFVYNRKS
ncbi:ABC transporter permease [Bogoriella caseilytica]|uniref:Transport permease protein n=1 Tax=Bogoriella caseilytica TaxID=56055 RepID=A0A3N2B9G2_9MICO|nr:ABC transporter permease [Bogoriella caseilytica]ROR71909.1 ABC-2 type transport system permease protein [Bogoriella caseilytica]